MKRLITGCGRAGTKFISTVLHDHDYDMPHEAEGRDGSVSFYAAGMPYDTLDTYDVILHQVRNPIDAISSIHTMHYWDTDSAYHSGVRILECMPDIRDDNYTLQCAKYWYFWNTAAERISQWTYQIEQLSDPGHAEVFQSWARRLNIDLTSESFFASIERRKHNASNSRKDRAQYTAVTWARLFELDVGLSKNICHLAARYGYEAGTD